MLVLVLVLHTRQDHTISVIFFTHHKTRAFWGAGLCVVGVDVSVKVKASASTNMIVTDMVRIRVTVRFRSERTLRLGL